MSGAGHVMDMNNRMKQNRAQRSSKRAKFKDNCRDGIYSKSGISQNRTTFNSVSEEELTETIEKIRKRAHLEQNRERIKYGFLLIGGIFGLIAFVAWIN